jgi:hypothetical protein
MIGEMFTWMIDHLWGSKTDAMFDLWSLQHIVTGMAIAPMMVDGFGNRIKQIFSLGKERIFRFADILGVLFFAYLWEAIEFYMEIGAFGSGVAHWYRGMEFWPNRFIADPLLLVAGYLVARKHPNIFYPAITLSATWITVAIVGRIFFP